MIFIRKGLQSPFFLYQTVNMTHRNALILLALITNMAIMIPAGHGIGPVILAELGSLGSGFLSGSGLIGATVLFCAVTQILLLVSLIQKNGRQKEAWILAALLTGCTGMVCYIVKWQWMAFLAGFPFFVLWLFLAANRFLSPPNSPK